MNLKKINKEKHNGTQNLANKEGVDLKGAMEEGWLWSKYTV